MKNIILLSTLLFCLNSNAEDLLFNCKGTLLKEYVGKVPLGREHQGPYELEENISVIVNDTQIILSADSSMMRTPTQYSPGNIEGGFNFPICKKQNHKISFNNYACNYEKTFNNVKNSMPLVDLVEGSLDGITNKLIITMRPSKDKIDFLQKRKSGFYSIETGEYQCLKARPSF
jgi:hypothetical protein